MTASTTGTGSAELPALLLPAMGVAPRYYSTLVSQLESLGFAVTIPALGLSESHKLDAAKGIDGYARIVERQIPAAYQAAVRSTPSGNVVIIGHSLGGQLGLVFAGHSRPDIPVVLVASGSAHFQGYRWPRSWLYLIGAQAAGLVAAVLGHWPGHRLGFGGSQSSETMRDWARNVRSGRYKSRAASFKYESALSQFRGRTLAIEVAGDTLAPARATQLLLQKSRPASIEIDHYIPTRNNDKPGAHFTWAKDAPGVVPRIASWITALDP